MTYVPAEPVMPRPLNVATPAMAVAVRVPLNVAEPPESVAVIMAVAEDPVVTVKELASWIVTDGCESSAPPLAAPTVARLVESFVAAADVITIVFVAMVRPPAE